MGVDSIVYVSNLPSNIEKKILHELFLQAGPIEDVILKGTYGFIVYEDEESVPYALALFEGTVLYDKLITIKPKQDSKWIYTPISQVPPFINGFEAKTKCRYDRNRYDYQLSYNYDTNTDIYSNPGLTGVKSIVLVLSGKGGVGKSTISSQLAINLWKQGLKVGILDIDLCGPSIPRMLGLDQEEVYQSDKGWLPVYADKLEEKRLAVMSLSFVMQNKSNAVIWRGPRKCGMIEQLLNKVVCWSELDCLIIDTPPGTSDEHISCVEIIQKESQSKLRGAVIVTTPQRVSLCDVRREIDFCQKTSVPILGLVENMSGYNCPYCSQCTRIFSQGGGEQLALEKGLKFLGRIAIDPQLTNILDSDKSFSLKVAYRNSDLENLAQIISTFVL